MSFHPLKKSFYPGYFDRPLSETLTAYARVTGCPFGLSQVPCECVFCQVILPQAHLLEGLVTFTYPATVEQPSSESLTAQVNFFDLLARLNQKAYDESQQFPPPIEFYPALDLKPLADIPHRIYRQLWTTHFVDKDTLQLCTYGPAIPPFPIPRLPNADLAELAGFGVTDGLMDWMIETDRTSFYPEGLEMSGDAPVYVFPITEDVIGEYIIATGWGLPDTTPTLENAASHDEKPI